MSTTLLILALAACRPTPLDTAEAPPTEDLTRREDGWLRGDLHMHTTWSDGWDDVATVVRISEYLEDPTFLAAHPEYQDRGLDYIAITDHRTFDAWTDPAYASDRLVLLGGEEWGGASHAGVWGINEYVPHDQDDDDLDVEDIASSVALAHEQGGLFSPNHPFNLGTPFPLPVSGHDAVEVWNAGWALMAPDMTPEHLAEWEAAHGQASPLYRRAMEATGHGASFQALTWYEAQLARGVHVALVGGSDRHALMPVGWPTTWVQAEQPDVPGIIAGIQARHSFVSRTPVSAQLAVEVDYEGHTYAMGDAIPLGSSTSATIRVSVARADRGRLQLITGGPIDSDEALTGAPLGSVLLEQDLEDDPATVETEVTVGEGTWLYPRVLEPLFREGASAEEQATLRELTQQVVNVGDEQYLDLIMAILPMLDTDVLWDGGNCDPDDWDPDLPQCMTADDDGIATYFVPDHINRALNAWTENGQLTDWCMGAVGSAVRFSASDGAAAVPAPDRF